MHCCCRHGSWTPSLVGASEGHVVFQGWGYVLGAGYSCGVAGAKGFAGGCLEPGTASGSWMIASSWVSMQNICEGGGTGVSVGCLHDVWVAWPWGSGGERMVP